MITGDIQATVESHKQRAFTLIEIMVAVAIVGLILSAASLTLNNLTRSDLRSGARKTAAAVQFAFDRAMLSGQYVRLAFDLEKGEIWAEATTDRVLLHTDKEGRAKKSTTNISTKSGEETENTVSAAPKKQKNPFGLFGFGSQGQANEKTSEGAGASEGGEEGLGLDTQALMAEYEADLQPPSPPTPSFQPIKGPGSKKLTMGRNITIAAVATPRTTDPIKKGKAYLYFFPQGHTEPAVVHFKDKSNDYYSLIIHPLTGRAEVFPCRLKPSREWYSGGEINEKIAGEDVDCKSGGGS